MYSRKVSQDKKQAPSVEKTTKVIQNYEKTIACVDGIKHGTVGGTVIDKTVGKIFDSISEENQKYRPRSENEKLIRATISAIGTTGIIFGGNPAGYIVSGGLALSEFGELDAHTQIESNKKIYDNAYSTFLKTSGKEKADEIARDLIFDRCVNRIP
jgi:hypothetical protein